MVKVANLKEHIHVALAPYIADISQDRGVLATMRREVSDQLDRELAGYLKKARNVTSMYVILL